MADDVTFQRQQLATPPVSTKVATDEVNGAHMQRVKMDIGGEGVSSPVTAANPLPIATDGLTDAELRATPVVVDAMANYDSFGRIRVSNPYTLFDSKQIKDNLPLYYDDQEVSGSGTTSVYAKPRASTTIGVAATTAGKRIRQTFQRFNYQPGKSQYIFLTGVLLQGGGGAGITAGMGYYDDDNGIFVQAKDSVISMNVRSSSSGAAVDNSIAQADWNGDKLDGTGASGITFDPSASQIFWTDLEWLGVGTVRTGFVIDGQFITCHSFNHANTLGVVYMSTPNLPIRYEIENDGTGAASTLEHICSTVMSEGGVQAQGQLHVALTGNSQIAAAQDDLVALIGIKLKAANLDQQIDLASASILNDAKEPFEWTLWINPTVAGTFTYADHDNSSVQIAYGVASNLLTGGHEITGGLVSGSRDGSHGEAELSNALRLGSAIDGTPDEIILAIRSYKAAGLFDAALGWRELS